MAQKAKGRWMDCIRQTGQAFFASATDKAGFLPLRQRGQRIKAVIPQAVFQTILAGLSEVPQSKIFPDHSRTGTSKKAGHEIFFSWYTEE